MLKKKNLAAWGVIILASFLFCFNLFANKGRPDTYDSLTHLSNIAQFHTALKDGDFPVRWLDKSANYGMPYGSYSQQTLAYLGGWMLFLVPDVKTVANILILVFAVMSSGFLFVFLKEYTDRWSALIGSLVYSFEPYRIVNIYIRGAMLEFAAAAFLPLIMLSIKKWIGEGKTNYFFVFVLSLTGLFLTHPISIVTYLFLTGMYFGFMFFRRPDRVKLIIKAGMGCILALGISAYYLMPLRMEFKYENLGSQKSIFTANTTLPWDNVLNPERDYFSLEALKKAQYLEIGIVETVILLGGLLAFGWMIVRKKKINPLFGAVWISAIIYFFLMSKWGTWVFENIHFLGDIQHQWRLMSGILFVVAIIVAIGMGRIKGKLKYILGAGLVMLILFLRLPRLKAFNYAETPNGEYFATKTNLYADIMNTVWTGKTDDYPQKNEKGEVVEGKGKIVERTEKNSWRKYLVEAEEDIRMADYTFYYPGWKVYVDGAETEIQWQDPNYRGFLTYNVSAGNHEVEVRFEDTKVRRLANIISVVSIVVFGMGWIMKKKLKV